MIEYKCPICGGDVDVWCLTSYPPITEYRCRKNCGYYYQEKDVIEIKIAPRYVSSWSSGNLIKRINKW